MGWGFQTHSLRLPDSLLTVERTFRTLQTPFITR